MPKTLNSSFATYTTMMRITKKGRPFTKDLYDMFSAVLLQIELTDHRTFFRTYPYTFTTDEAIKVMSSLQFIHVHRQPDPSDPSRQISTRTTTTFTMDTTTAKNMIQYFLSARLIMNATDPNNWTVKDKGLWCPTLKGKYILEEFADYTQVEMKNSLIAALNAPYMVPSVSGSTGGRIIKLDRLTDHDDQITFSRANMTIAFKAMLASLPLDALVLDDVGGIDRKNLSRYQHTFLGTQCVEWLADRLTVSSKEEAEMVASEFVLFGWIGLVVDKSDKSLCVNEDGISFKTSRFAIYYVTERGLVIAGWKSPQEEAIQQASDISFTSETSSSSKSSMIKHRPSPQSSVSRGHRHVDEEGPSSATMSRSSSLAGVSSFVEAKFYRTVTEEINPHVGRYVFAILFFGAGMFNASTAYLPSSFAMYCVFMAYSYALRPVSDIDPTRTYRVVFWIGLGALAGWPFAALIGIPFAMEEVLIFGRDTMKKADGTVVQSIGGPRWRLRRIVRLSEAALLVGLGLTVLLVLMDQMIYRQYTIVAWNIIKYNIFSDGRGPELYGTEPWYYYILNGFLNFNIVFLLFILPDIALSSIIFAAL
ncbi:hypothetical protein RMATCC62417_12409 [Rhizopus microsporus]|nr:hypothetical protein RMATCC62417_12409 [Rhizopus microsporus]